MTESDVRMLFQEIQDMRKENKADHDAILAQQRITNGTVKVHEDILNNPDTGIRGDVKEIQKEQVKLSKSFFKFKIIYTPLIFIIAILGGQWLEEVLRDTPFSMNKLIQFLLNLGG
jgi:crotonobetainyl-CoA:carnitine CoA-transferase CaiB-like acyl-CoA transferase